MGPLEPADVASVEHVCDIGGGNGRFLAALLAACLNVAVSANALTEGIELDDLKTTVNTSVDPTVLFGVQDVEEAEACLKGVQGNIEVQGEGLTEEDLERIHEISRRSPLHTLVSF